MIHNLIHVDLTHCQMLLCFFAVGRVRLKRLALFSVTANNKFPVLQQIPSFPNFPHNSFWFGGRQLSGTHGPENVHGCT